MISFDKKTTFAVVGASSRPEKYGYQVFKLLLQAGYKVYPVNPRGGLLLDQIVYQSLTQIPDSIELVIMVVPWQIGIKVLEEISRLGITQVWFQPGSESEELLDYCRTHHLNYQANACIMLENHN